MNLIKYIILPGLLFILGCSKPCFIDKEFLGVNDQITFECAKKEMNRVRGVDIEMYKLELDSNLVVLYSFFSGDLYNKDWIYYIDTTKKLETYFPKGVYCRTKNCILRLKDGEEVFLDNSINNQLFSCKLFQDEGEKAIMKFYYKFKE